MPRLKPNDPDLVSGLREYDRECGALTCPYGCGCDTLLDREESAAISAQEAAFYDQMMASLCDATMPDADEFGWLDRGEPEPIFPVDWYWVSEGITDPSFVPEPDESGDSRQEST